MSANEFTGFNPRTIEAGTGRESGSDGGSGGEGDAGGAMAQNAAHSDKQAGYDACPGWQFMFVSASQSAM
eukprot:6191359-Pleurochrysis_carterae.AAC.4